MIKLSIQAGRARGATLAAAGALALTACGNSGPASQQPTLSSPTSPATGHASTPAAVPSSPASVGLRPAAGFHVLSMSFVSDQRGFALGTVRCGSGRCLALLGTLDGGSSWRRLTAPTRPAGRYGTCPADTPCVRQVRFATPLIGYAFDPSLLVTSDGGVHWRWLPRVNVSSLEAAAGTAVRIAPPSYNGCTGGPYQVGSAPIGTNTWRALPAPAIEQICPPVLYRQGERLVLAGYGNPAGGVRASAQIDRSGDGGLHWASGPDSCGGTDGYASAVALAPPDVLVLLCQHQQPESSGAYRPAWIRVSVNGGASFGPDQILPSRPAVPRGMLLGYQLAAASADRLLVAATGQRGSQILLSQNGGRSWVTSLRLPADGPALLVGYQDPVTARITQADTVWTTRDGGRNWIADHYNTG